MPDVPGYSVWLHCRSGCQRASGGVAVLVHERLNARTSRWRAGGAGPPSPHHFWLRIDSPLLGKPLLLAAVYLPPYRSKYGLKDQQELEAYFCELGDEAAAAAAVRGGASVLVAGDINAHAGKEQDGADLAHILHRALPEEAALALETCTQQGAYGEPPPRVSSCNLPLCPQGSALLTFCAATGLRIMNGRVEGDMQGSPTCFTGDRPTLIDYYVASADLLARAQRLRVLPRLPESILGHAPVELVLAPGTTAQLGPEPVASGAEAGGDEVETSGPPPVFDPPLRTTPECLKACASEFEQPALLEQLDELATLASRDPLLAASQLESVLYDTAAAVCPAASQPSDRHRRQLSSGAQLQRRVQPWFDAECKAARRRIRELLLEDAQQPRGPSSHLARQALRALGNKYIRLRQRKAAAWQRRQGTALLQLHRHNAAKLWKLWKRKNAGDPLDAATWLRHHTRLQLRRAFKPSGPRPPADLGSAGDPPPHPELDADITSADVVASLRKLSPSSACLGPLKAAFIKAGSNALAPVLARLFTALLRAGLFPPRWALGAMTHILKKGDPSDPNNYRGITVGHVIGKLYALTLNTRLAAWLEARGKRASGQAGFRKGYRTVDNCFILRALVERARARGVKLYICAVDFEKAFDCVNRDELWAALRRAGIGGCMLRAIQSMYAAVPVCVKTAEGLSPCFDSVLGVKQGCPLSPLLFGVLLDDFEGCLQRALGAVASLPTLAGHTVPPLLFADDMLLIATSPAGLQAQLDFLQSYCDAKKLTVNAAKTQVMVFKPGGGGGGVTAASDRFSYAGHQLETARSVKYLGLTFAQLSKQHGFARGADELAAAGQRALFAMRSRAHELGAGTPEQQCMLFDTLVKPVLSYGCEVWGVDVLARADCSSERVHRWFCRRIQGLPTQVSSAVSLAELGRWPLHLHWLQQLARFWNRLLSMDDQPDRLLRWAFEDNLSLMREGGDLASGSPCWCRKWFDHLQAAPTDTGTLVWLTPLREGELVERATQAYIHQAMQAAKFCYYITHIRGAQPLGTPAPHLGTVTNYHHRVALSRFRTSCHDLRIERERHLPQEQQAPRHKRTCLMCASDAVEDESHAVFDCPLYEDLRWDFADLFTPHLPQSVSSFLSHNLNRLAHFTHECSVRRRLMRV